MIKQSVKKPFTVLVAVIIVLTMAAVSLTQMVTDLLPNMSIPYLVVIATYPGASPEKVEANVTILLEEALGTVSGVENVTSQSAENYALVMLEFEDDTDMDSALVKVNSALDEVEGSLPELCGTPNIMEVSMDMVATMYLAISADDMDIYQLSDFAEETLIPQFQRQDGVASISELGLLEELLEVRLNQDKVDKINDQLLQSVNSKLLEAKQELEEAQAELDDSQEELNSSTSTLDQQQSSISTQLGESSLAMSQAVATQSAYTAQVNSLKANQTALQLELDAYEQAGVQEQYDQINQMLAALHSGTLTDITGTTGEDSDSQESSYTQLLVEGAQKLADAAGLDVTVSSANLESVLSKMDGDLVTKLEEAVQTQMEALAKEQAAQLTKDLPTDIDDAIANPDKLAALVSLLQQQGQEEMAQQLTAENLTQLSEIVNTRIPQIETELANLAVEITAAQAVLDSVNSSVSQAIDSYADLEAGKIQAATGFSSASAQLSSAQSALENAQAQLDEARTSYDNAREAALQSANIDQLVDIDTLAALIYAENFTMPAGYISDESDNQWLLKVGDSYTSQEELASMVLADLDGVGEITLADVADLTCIDNAGDSYTKLNGNQAVILSIFKGSTAGTSAVSQNCNEVIQELEEQYDGLSIHVLSDQGSYIQMFLQSITSSILIGAALAMLVLALFLRDVLPTLVVAFSIPFSVLVAVLAMYFSGITLNMMSMAGLALGIGMLVDNSIVVIENIFRLRGRGLSAPRSAVQGGRQVAGAIISSTLTTICVFLPMIFTTGMTRQLMLPFALTIAYSLLASLLVALTVVPSLSSVLLRRSQPKEHRWFRKVQTVYGKGLDFCLRRKVVPLGVAILLLAVSVVEVARMGIVMLPNVESDQLFVTATLSEDLEQEACYAIADEVMDKLMEVDGVQSVGAMSNAKSLLSSTLATTSNNYTHYTFYLELEDTIKTTAQINRLRQEMAETLAQVEDCETTISASAMGDMSSIMSSGLSVNIYGDDLDTLLSISQDVMELVEQVEGFTEISNGQEEGDQEIRLNIDKDKSMVLGLTVAQIYQELVDRITTDKDAVVLTIDGTDTQVTVVDETNLLTKENLLETPFSVTTTDGDGQQITEIHYLSEFATLEYTTGVDSIARENNVRYLTVTADTQDGYTTTRLAKQLQNLLADYQLPQGYSLEISGEYEEVSDMLLQMIGMMALGLLFIYLVMVAQFQSLLSPFIILFTVPLAFTGGLLGLAVAGEQLSLMSLMGFLVLMGTVVNNGIVFVDYANQLRLGGMEKRAALIATGKTRMRPILMTALTTILAMSAMIFSHNLSASLSRGMAVVVAGGLAYATLMTLFVVPVMYDILYRKQPKEVDVGDDSIDDAPDDAAEFIAAALAAHKQQNG